jgi:hypothetical protein
VRSKRERPIVDSRDEKSTDVSNNE